MADKMRSIFIMIPWLDPWPAWLRCFLESCRWNPPMDRLQSGDAPPPDVLPRNLRTVTIGFEDYCTVVASRVRIKVERAAPYKDWDG